MAELTLEVIEGPDAGKTAALTGTVEIGRDPAADLPLRDEQASRQHARIRAQADGAMIEDLGSSNGTFVNHNELHGPGYVSAGDEVLIGVSVIQVRNARQIAAQRSAVRAVPPALAISERRPTFTDPVEKKKAAVVPELDRLRDSRTKAQARLAPFALIVLVVFIVAIYFGATT